MEPGRILSPQDGSARDPLQVERLGAEDPRAVDGLADAIVLLQHPDGETHPRKPLRGVEPGRPAPHDQHIGCGVDGGSDGEASLPPQLTAWCDPPQHEIAKPALRTT